MVETFNEETLRAAEIVDISQGWLQRIQEGSEQRFQGWNISPEDIPAILS